MSLIRPNIPRDQIDQLCRKHRVRSLWLFGSAVRDDFDPARSDFDFLVEFDEMPPAEHADAYFELLSGIERVMGAKVDLVERSAVRNPVVRRTIEEDKVPLYAAA